MKENGKKRGIKTRKINKKIQWKEKIRKKRDNNKEGK